MLSLLVVLIPIITIAYWFYKIATFSYSYDETRRKKFYKKRGRVYPEVLEGEK